MQSLKDTLPRLMEERGFTQKSLAVAAGLNDTAVRDILKGKSKNPTGKTLNALARALSVDVVSLLSPGIETDDGGGDGRSEGLSERLRIARSHANLNQERLAELIGLESHAAISRYENGKRRPGRDELVRIAEACRVDPGWLMLGNGPGPIGGEGQDASTEHEQPVSIQAEDGMRGAVLVDELDVRASGGYGIVHDVAEAERVTSRWQMPRNILQAQTSAPASSLKIITVYGDSMAPDFLPGERVLVDTSDRRPSPPGVFVLWDGLALVIKRLEVMPGAEAVRIIPANAHYSTYEQPLADVQINGRVIGKWQWT